MHECLLCKRDMKVSNDVLGNGCVRNIYSFLDLKMPRKVNHREETLYKNIMKINNINSINKNQKIWLTDRYLTYQYLNRIPYGNYNTIKNQINNDIQNNLYFAIHSADLHINGKKANDKWNLEIMLHDRYDYSKPKMPDQYYNDTSSVAKSMLSSTLYNLASFSTKCTVMKEYDIDIQFYIEGFEVI